MTVTIKGPFGLISQIRDFVQGDSEPYLYGIRGGYIVTGMEDDSGAGSSVLLLSEATIAGKDAKQAEKDRAIFVQTLQKSFPALSLSR